jgi:hypothetical protein
MSFTVEVTVRSVVVITPIFAAATPDGLLPIYQAGRLNLNDMVTAAIVSTRSTTAIETCWKGAIFAASPNSGDEDG